VGCVYVANLVGGWISQVDWNGGLSSSQAGVNEDLNSQTVEKMTGYTNIALFGLDNRSVGNYAWGNSDTIMIASINNDTKEVKLVSVYRDTYLSIGEGKFNKANSAYNLGGVERAVKMLNANLDLSITDYVCVDWAALIEAIDALGGIELQVTKQEVYYINGY
jgi:anionic cell wall polymer biosynthesis LytR-Cps2A-Psr (LCP) family protein